MKMFLSLLLIIALQGLCLADDGVVEARMEDSTVAPPIQKVVEVALANTTASPSKMEKDQHIEPMAVEKPASLQKLNIADFVIHPLIAVKEREMEEAPAEGKQASGEGSSTTPAPWTIFGFNPGQGLIGTSVQSLAGTVSGWLTDRIQLPSFVESPVRDSSTTTTTTTTTAKPDIVIQRIGQQNTRRPLIQINNKNRPNRFNDLPLSDENEEEYDDEYDEDEEDAFYGDENESNDNRVPPPLDFDANYEDDETLIDDEDLDNEADNYVDQEDLNLEPSNEKKKQTQQNQAPNKNNGNSNRRPLRTQQANKNHRVRKPINQIFSEENADDVSAEYDDDAADEETTLLHVSPVSTKRSQNQPSILQLGQQSLLNQIRHLTQSNQAEKAPQATTRKGPKDTKTRRQPQADEYVVQPNGQTVVLTPLSATGSQGYYYVQKSSSNRLATGNYPVPPLSKPSRRKSRPTQYITIPWSQLGITTPNRLVNIAEGVQSQPLILNIPASAIENMENNKPALTAEAVPLLTEASLMDIFKPPSIPPSRTVTTTITSPSKSQSIKAKPSTAQISNKVRAQTVASLLGQHIKPVTIVEQAPEMVEPASEKNDTENKYIIVGEDPEAGHLRNSAPSLPKNSHFEILSDGRLALRRTGRGLAAEAASEQNSKIEKETAGVIKPSATVGTGVVTQIDKTSATS